MNLSPGIPDTPEAIRFVTWKLRSAGYQALVVGGSVRDRLMGRKPKDWDIATDALPSAVMAIFDRAVPTGIKYGTVTVMAPGGAAEDDGPTPITKVEVTTFRRDGDYGDGRRPDNVVFGDSIEEDLARRDFTINAMAMDPETGKLVDPFAGASDLNSKVIRAVGRAAERFREDALRMLRAARLAAQLGFEIEPKTLSDIRTNADLVRKVAFERIREELNRLLLAPGVRRGLEILASTGLMGGILPEITGPESALEQSFEVCAKAWPDLPVRLAALLLGPGVGPLAAGKALSRLKYDRKTARKVLTLVKEAGWESSDQRSIRRLIARVGRDLVPSLVALRKAQNTTLDKGAEEVEALSLGLRASENEALNEKELAVSGQDIVALGVPPGPAVGRILTILLEAVLDDPRLNDRGKLLGLARGMIAGS